MNVNVRLRVRKASVGVIGKGQEASKENDIGGSFCEMVQVSLLLRGPPRMTSFLSCFLYYESVSASRQTTRESESCVLDKNIHAPYLFQENDYTMRKKRL